MPKGGFGELGGQPVGSIDCENDGQAGVPRFVVGYVQTEDRCVSCELPARYLSRGVFAKEKQCRVVTWGSWVDMPIGEYDIRERSILSLGYVELAMCGSKLTDRPCQFTEWVEFH